MDRDTHIDVDRHNYWDTDEDEDTEVGIERSTDARVHLRKNMHAVSSSLVCVCSGT